MKASGDKQPDIYILGEAPTAEDDKQGEHFAGTSGQLLLKQIPKKWRDRIRFNNVINCRTPAGRDPEPIERECCRPRVEKDIIVAQPLAIFGMGNVPLHWALQQNGIVKWRGRKIPVKIGNHVCWYFPMLDPTFVARSARRSGESKEEHVFRLDLRRAFAEINDLPPPPFHSREKAFTGLTSVDWCDPRAAGDIVRFLEKAASEPESGLDYETSHLRPYRPETKILSIGIAIKGKAIAFPYDHPEAKWSKPAKEMIRQAFLAYLKAPVRKIAHNLAFEMEWTAVKFGKELLRGTQWGDSMVQAYTLDERVGGKPDQEQASKDTSCLGLGFITLNRFGINIKTLSNVDTKNMESEPLEAILPYNAVDAKYCLELFWNQAEELELDGLTKLYQRRIRRIPTLVLTQIKGMPVDFEQADRLDDKLSTAIAKATKAIATDPDVAAFRKKYKKDFKPGSDTDCVKMFRDIVGSDAGKSEGYNGGEASYSVTKSVLEKIDAPIAKKVLDWRAPSKLASTYVWPKGHKYVYPDGKLHPILNGFSTVTGRSSSEDPNSQNLPKRTDDGKEIRRQIAAPEGHLLCSVDYGQIEGRCIAMESQDKVYAKMLWEDYDVHMDWAEQIAYEFPVVVGGKKYIKDKGVMKGFRQTVKGGWVFALFFGAQQSTAERQVGLPEGSLGRLYKEFWKTFSGVKEWQERIIADFKEQGYVENAMGIRRRAPISPNQLINAPIQNLASEIVIDGMNALSEKEDWYFQPICNIHDDLTSIFPVKGFDDYAEEKIDTLLTKTYPFLNVPLVVEMSIGPNLCDMDEIGKYASNTWKK
jgi:uracil-DNA glycosylase family 4